jgi:hypothetical protein
MERITVEIILCTWMSIDKIWQPVYSSVKAGFAKPACRPVYASLHDLMLAAPDAGN